MKRRFKIQLSACAVCALLLSVLSGSQFAWAAGHSDAIPASGSPAKYFTRYQSTAAGITIDYPRGWKIVQHPDKDCLVKFQSMDNSSGGEISLSRISGPTANVRDTAHLFETAIFPKLQNYKKLQERKISFGPNHNLEGDLFDISFEFGTTAVNQRYVFFPHGPNVLTLAFTSAASAFSELTPVFNDVLLSVQLTRPSANGSTHGATTEKDNTHFQLTPFRAKNIPFRFAYPSDWSAELRNDPDHPLEITGKDSHGHVAVLSLYTNDWNPDANLEQIAQAVDNRYLANKPGYRQTKCESVSFGSGSGLDGVVREASFQENGIPAKQIAVFFRDKERLEVISLTSFGWNESSINALFHKLLATIELD